MTDFTLTNARIVLETEVIQGTLRVEGGKIADVSTGGSSVPGAVDVAGDLIIPGLIELHTDNLERHIEPRPKVDWPHKAAIIAHDAELASVGITTVFDAMRVGSIIRAGDAGGYAKYARSLSRELMMLRNQNALKISHFLHLRAEVCSETLEAEMAEFGPEDRIGLVSLMDHTPGQRQFRDISKLKDYVQKKRGMSDAQFEEHVSHLLELRDTYGARHEEVAVAEANRYGAVLASHDDTTADHVERLPHGVIGRSACGGDRVTWAFDVIFHRHMATGGVVHQLGHNKGMHPVFALFIDHAVIVVLGGQTTAGGAQNHPGPQRQFPGKLKPGLANRLLGGDQCKLSKPVIERHLLAVELAFCVPCMDLAADFDRQPIHIAEIEVANATFPLGHRGQGRGHIKAERIDGPGTGDDNPFHAF